MQRDSGSLGDRGKVLAEDGRTRMTWRAVARTCNSLGDYAKESVYTCTCMRSRREGGREGGREGWMYGWMDGWMDGGREVWCLLRREIRHSLRDSLVLAENEWDRDNAEQALRG